MPLADYNSGRAAKGYTCNAVQVGHIGSTGGFKTFRYVDRTGRVCAFYDGTLLFPTAVFHNEEAPGVHVLDMSDPARPIETDRLVTPAMDSPHESLRAQREARPARRRHGLAGHRAGHRRRLRRVAGLPPPGAAVVDAAGHPRPRERVLAGRPHALDLDDRQPGVTAIDVSNPHAAVASCGAAPTTRSTA